MADKAKLLQVAQKHLSKGNLDKAIKTFQQLVELDSRDQRLILRLADIQARAGRKKEAIENYEKVALGYMRQDFTPKAIAVYKTILRLDPELLSAYEKLAELYKNQGLEAEALAQFENLFQVYEKKNDEDKQINVLKLMADMDPENLGFQVRLGETLAKKGRKKEAAEAFAKAAATLSRRGFHDRASQLFEKITALNPDNTTVRRELCAHYLESGQFQEARAEIEAILSLEPDDPRMVLLLGRILFQLGNKAEGEEKIAQSISLFLESGELESVMREFLFVAQSHLRNGEVDEAEAFYRQIRSHVPEEVRAIKGLVSIAETRKDRVGQIENLLLLGRTMQQSGDREGAVKAYRKVHELDPLNEEAKDVLQGADAVETARGLQEDLSLSSDEEGLDEDLVEIQELEPLDAEEVALEVSGQDENAQEVYFPELDEGEDGTSGEGASDQEVELLDLEEEGLEPAHEFALDDEIGAVDEAIPEDPDAGDDAPQMVYEEDVDDEAIPDIVLDDFGEDEFVMEVSAGDEEEPEDLPPAEGQLVTEQVPDEMPLEDLLAEVDVYKRYGLADKAAETLERARAAAPDDQRVLDRIAAIEGGAGVEGLPPASEGSTPEDRTSLENPEEPDQDLDAFGEDLEEADFYHSQGLEDEASRIYQSILERDPQHLRAAQALASIEGKDAAQSVPEPGIPLETVIESQFDPDSAKEVKSKLVVKDAVPEDMGGFFDIADELRHELSEEMDARTEPEVSDGPVSFEEIFSQFKKGIEETLGDEEYETHYNLGIAYKDMGLYDDAIREFESGTRDPVLAKDSFSLMAMCYVEKKEYESAVKAIEEALSVSDEDSKTGLYYQLGEVKEKQKKWSEAASAYERVRQEDPSFEGIGQAIERTKSSISDEALTDDPGAISAEGGMDDMLTDLIREVEEMARESSGESDDDPGKPKKDRISYL